MNFYLTVVKTPFALLQIQLKMLFGNAVKLVQMTFCLIPKVLYPIDVVLPFGKVCTVVYAKVAKLTDTRRIVALITICINDAVRLYLLTDNRQQGGRLRIGYGNGINLAVAL